MAPCTGFNSPGTGDLLDVERSVAPFYVKLVQAVYREGGF